MSRSTLKYSATYHYEPKSPSAPLAGAKVNLSDENVDFLPLDEIRFLKLDYDSLRLDFAFGTLGSFVGAGVAANTGGGLVSRIGFSTAFEGAFAGAEQVARNLANGDSWSQDVRQSILSSIIFQGGSEILSNGREVLQAGRRFLQAGDNLVDDVLGALDGRRLATPDGVGDHLFRSVDEVPNVPKGGNKFAASTGKTGDSGGISDGANTGGPGTERWRKKIRKDGQPHQKPGPKTDPNSPHNKKIQEIIDQYSADDLIHVGGGEKTEITISTPGGVKSERRADVTFQDPNTGELFHFNVGLSNKRGDPIIRERQALEDIRKLGTNNTQIQFRSYGTKQ